MKISTKVKLFSENKHISLLILLMVSCVPVLDIPFRNRSTSPPPSWIWILKVLEGLNIRFLVDREILFLKFVCLVTISFVIARHFVLKLFLTRWKLASKANMPHNQQPKFQCRTKNPQILIDNKLLGSATLLNVCGYCKPKHSLLLPSAIHIVMIFS